jgi:hypothetical protein
MVKMAELTGHTPRALFMAQVNFYPNISQMLSALVHVNLKFANVLVW